MIVSTKDDTVTLSGSLVRNQWLTIKAAANLLMRENPQGIIIDCGELEHVSEEGAKTFLEAMRDIQSAGARIMVCNLPETVMGVLRTVPGVRSQLPIARSVEEARGSLRLSGEAPSAELSQAASDHAIIVPLAEGLDVEYAVIVAGRIARELRLPLHFVCLLVVARHLPLGAPLPEAEEEANHLIEQAGGAAARVSVPFTRHVERVRDAQEGMLQAIRSYRASHVVLSVHADVVDQDEYVNLIHVLLHRAPCNVVIARQAPTVKHPATPGAFIPADER
jgi:anti-anti-sigma regulatory factor